MASQALQTPTTSTAPLSILNSQPTVESTGTLYCDSYSNGTCIGWKTSTVPIPSLNISLMQNQSNTASPSPSNATTPNSTTVDNSTQNITTLKNQYAQELSIIQNSPIGTSGQQSEKNALNQLYNLELQAAQLNASCFSSNLTVVGGSQGIEALQNAMNCVASAQ